LSEPFDHHQLVRSSASESLPGDYVAFTARRAAIAAAGIGVLHLIYLVLYRTIWSAAANLIGLLAGIAGLLISVAAAAYLLSGQRPARHVAMTVAVYEFLLAFVISFSDSTIVSTYTEPIPHVSWSAVLIVLVPFLIPASPRVTLCASLAAAASGPLALALLLSFEQRPWPPIAVTASYVLPLFLCAVLAWAPTSALHRLGVAVQQARRLGNYELGERLGQGGMGEVWLANHRLLARPAAVKLIKPEMLGAKNATSRAALLRRFEKEAQVTASLESVHSVELYDFGVSAQGQLFYVMELLRGVDVQALVERFGPLPPERVIYLLMQACDSLEDAHARGLIHRDIKPANLFLTRKGGSCDFLKVLDFGLVKRWRAEDDVALLDTLHSLEAGSRQSALGQIVGTPAFLAPEAALGEQAIDARADLYALGCVAYWMLTGVLVFEESSAVGLAVAHVTREPPPPSQRADRAIDPELERLTLQCLQKDRERRPASAAALRDALAAIALAEPWSRKRAAAWWQEHLPEISEQRMG
jgi:eukaryotic-like serine/threonine-protein kinase